ncbi:hypothetical protein ACE6H2_024366 [Prunus campanulata]
MRESGHWQQSGREEGRDTTSNSLLGGWLDALVFLLTTPIPHDRESRGDKHTERGGWMCFWNKEWGDLRIEAAVDFLLCVGYELGEAVGGDGDGGSADIKIGEVEIPSLLIVNVVNKQKLQLLEVASMFIASISDRYIALGREALILGFERVTKGGKEEGRHH